MAFSCVQCIVTSLHAHFIVNNYRTVTYGHLSARDENPNVIVYLLKILKHCKLLSKLAHALNDGRQYELRIDLFDWEGERPYAKYMYFYVAPENDNYRLNISGYSGNTGGDTFVLHQNGQQFSTIDRDNDAWFFDSCVALFGGGGFWFGGCGYFVPNGRYGNAGSRVTHSSPDLHWVSFRGDIYSLKAVSMAFRRAATN